MENNDRYDVEAALRDAQEARGRVADRASAPSYYYPVLGLAVGLMVAAEALGGLLAPLGCMVGAVIAGVLIAKYRDATGLWVTYGSAGRRSRGVWVGYGVGLFVLLAAAVWVHWAGRSAWWGVPLGAVALATTVAVGKVLEPRLREDLRSGRTTAFTR